MNWEEVIRRAYAVDADRAGGDIRNSGQELAIVALVLAEKILELQARISRLEDTR